MNTRTLTRVLGITPRQIQWWRRKRVIGGLRGGGSGRPLEFDPRTAMQIGIALTLRRRLRCNLPVVRRVLRWYRDHYQPVDGMLAIEVNQKWVAWRLRSVHVLDASQLPEWGSTSAHALIVIDLAELTARLRESTEPDSLSPRPHSCEAAVLASDQRQEVHA